MADGKLSYAQYLAQQDEVVKRARAIKARLDKMEFLASPVVASDAAATAVAALYAALAKMIEVGLPLSLVSQLSGMFYMLSEEHTVERLLDAARNELAFRKAPTDGTVM